MSRRQSPPDASWVFCCVGASSPGCFPSINCVVVSLPPAALLLHGKGVIGNDVFSLSSSGSRLFIATSAATIRPALVRAFACCGAGVLRNFESSSLRFCFSKHPLVFSKPLIYLITPHQARSKNTWPSVGLWSAFACFFSQQDLARHSWDVLATWPKLRGRDLFVPFSWCFLESTGNIRGKKCFIAQRVHGRESACNRFRGVEAAFCARALPSLFVGWKSSVRARFKTGGGAGATRKTS